MTMRQLQIHGMNCIEICMLYAAVLFSGRATVKLLINCGAGTGEPLRAEWKDSRCLRGASRCGV